MALHCMLKGRQAFSLSQEDINKYPGSLLHSLLESVPSPDGLEVNLPDSIPTAWPAAVAITTELYRKGYIEAATLSGLLRQHTTADLCTKLQALIDYLALPGPLTKYLPGRNRVPLIHAGVLDLCKLADLYPFVQDAVQAMLTSTAFTDHNFCKRTMGYNLGRRWWSPRTAFFYLTTHHANVQYTSPVKAYAVADGGLSGWAPGQSTTSDSSAYIGPRHVLYEAVARPLPEDVNLPRSGTVSLHSLVKPMAQNGTERHEDLVHVIKALLREGLAATRSALNPAEMQVTLVDVYAGGCQAPLWVLHW